MEEFGFVLWLGHASFKLRDKKTNNIFYYLDPYTLIQTHLEPADVIFITHTHYDHFSPKDIEKLLKEGTVIVGPNDLDLGSLRQKVLRVKPQEEYKVKGLEFKTVPAYNIKSDRLEFHPKANNWVGYILNLNGKKIYHAGDTDKIVEMDNLKAENLDLALLPMGGTYTMDVKEASDAANVISAKYTAPIHYKALLGEKAKEAEGQFVNLVKNSQVFFLEELK